LRVKAPKTIRNFAKGFLVSGSQISLKKRKTSEKQFSITQREKKGTKED